MIAAMRAGVVAALEEHARPGQSIVTYDWETGRTCEGPPSPASVPTDRPRPQPGQPGE